MCGQTGRLEGKVAIITGAASGIGEATAKLFAEEGARLMLADVTENELIRVRDEVKRLQPDVISLVTNVAEEEQVIKLIETTLQEFGKIDIVCNNAGITGDYNNIDLPSQQTEDWLKVYKVNVMGAVYTMKHVAEHMCNRKCGAIINTASVAGIRAGAGPNAYSASKAALINLTQTSACDLGGNNIRVNAVCPGLIETGMTKPVFDYARQTGKENKLGKFCELRRYGLPEEVAQAILFLASDEASFITGQALAVDGGKTASLNLPGRKL
jgi:meso-butanediol dehydrogenase / (S,S)-butanediol dehydrogenase / diacetyl reductase